MLLIDNLTVSYADKTVLRELSATFEKGKLTSIVGINGSGKSTLLKSILGMLEKRAGKISLDGEDLSSLKRRDAAKRIAYLSQTKTLPDMTVMQMVMHGRFPYLSYPRKYSSYDRRMAFLAMEKMGIEHLAEERLASLSGGMRQSAYLAMALAQDTEYILLDEPTSFLDVGHQVQLMNLLCRLAKEGKGIIAVMHDLPLAFEFSDEIALLDEGRIILQASPEEMRESTCLEKVFGISLGKSDKGEYFYHFEK